MKYFLTKLLVLSVIATFSTLSLYAQNKELYLDEMDLSLFECGWKSPSKKVNLMGNPIVLQTQTYPRGIVIHAIAKGKFKLNKTVQRFQAVVGIDDAIIGLPMQTPVELVFIKNEVVLKSVKLEAGKKPHQIDLDLKDAETFQIAALGDGPQTNHTHTVLADARFSYTGQAPVMVPPYPTETEAPYILTPKETIKPRITGASVIGARPNKPILHYVSAIGKKPLEVGVENLPQGLKYDPQTRIISGQCSSKGEYKLKVTASNSAGKAERTLTLKIGDEICLTPPMGWNSWNAFGTKIDAEKVKATAKAFVDLGLRDHGWQYVNIDDGWQGTRKGMGPLQANEKFPDMKGLGDYIHSLGLKFGIYSTPWVESYGKHIGGAVDLADGTIINSGRRFGTYTLDREDAAQFAAWGVDYLKYDWGPLDIPHLRSMQQALDATNRDIVYSFSNTAPLANAVDYWAYGNVFRTTGDIIDTKTSMESIGFWQDRWAKYNKPGHWIDPDMLVIGTLGWGETPRKTRLRPSEQYTHISLWALLSAPLLLGCDMTQLDEFTLSLLTNADVIDINQDPLGVAATPIVKVAGTLTEVWAKPLSDGSKAVGLFNRGYQEVTIDLPVKELGIDPTKTKIRNLWTQKDLGTAAKNKTFKIPAGGVVLLKVGR